MKKFIAIASLLIVSFAGKAQTSTPYMFTGKLISTPTSQVDCGTMAFAGVYEFEIIMLSDESYTEANIPVIVPCPELFGQGFFKLGATYKMELFDNNSGISYSIINQPVLDAYTLPNQYWAGDIDAKH